MYNHRLNLYRCSPIVRAMRGLSTGATPPPPHSKKETIRRGRRLAQRMAANTQVKVSRDTKARKK